MTPGSLIGTHPWQGSVRERSGASVVAVQRAGKVMVELDRGIRIEPTDLIYVCGTAASLRVFKEEFGSRQADSGSS